MLIYKITIIISCLAFLFYGLNCLFSKEMIKEFRRFGLSNGQRKLTGALQLFASIGMGIGYFKLPILLLSAAIGLSLLMIVGFGVRLKIKDSLLLSLPSLVFAIVNAFIAFITYTIYIA